MLFNSLVVSTLLAIILPPAVLAGQIPIVNGVLGGVDPNQSSSRGGTKERISFSGEATTPGKLRYVSNSGICETTPGVNQASGYGDLTSDESILYVYPFT